MEGITWHGHLWIIHESFARVSGTKPVSGIRIRLLVCNDVVSMAACRPIMASGSNILIFKVKLGARDGGSMRPDGSCPSPLALSFRKCDYPRTSPGHQISNQPIFTYRVGVTQEAHLMDCFTMIPQTLSTSRLAALI